MKREAQQPCKTSRSQSHDHIATLRNNITELAKHLGDKKEDTLDEDHKFWVMENRHLSRLLKEKDTTIKSLKKGVLNHEGSQRSLQKEQVLNSSFFKSRMETLQKEVSRLNKTVAELSTRCEALESIVKTQQKEIEIFQFQSMRRKRQTEISATQTRLMYDHLGSEMNSRLFTISKDSLGSASLRKDKSNVTMDIPALHFSPSDNDNSSEKLTRRFQGYQGERDWRQVSMLKMEVQSLKEEMQRMRECHLLGQKEGRIVGGVSGNSLQDTKIKSKENLVSLLQKRIQDLQKEKERKGERERNALTERSRLVTSLQ